jgi:hypothetical protein
MTTPALYKELLLGVNVREALSWIAIWADQDGNKLAAQRCMELRASFEESRELNAHVQAVNFLCHLCDALRTWNEPEAVVKVEEIVKLLKGGKPRTVVGTVNYNIKPEDLDRLFTRFEVHAKALQAG